VLSESDSSPIVDKIRHAFAESPPPPRQAAAELHALREADLENLLELPWQVALERGLHDGDLFLLTAEGLAYYIPAFLIHILATSAGNGEWLLPEALVTKIDEIVSLGYWTVEQRSVVDLALRKMRRSVADDVNLRKTYKEILAHLKSCD